MSQDRKRSDPEFHRAVLAQEVADLVAPALPGLVVDATFGGGGHSRRLLDEFGEKVRIIAMDRDQEAVANARGLGVTALEGNFSEIDRLVRSVSDDDVAAVVFDFGVSSHQVDEPGRGFSYREDGPLDMRMGPDAPHTADEIVNTWPVHRLTDVIRRYGEEPRAGRIAAAIVAARPIRGTKELADVVAGALPAARRRVGHPARRTFQALRIAVNQELEAIETGLDRAIALLRVGGRVIAISYHSLEDRIVKRRLQRGARGCTCPPDLPVCGCGNSVELRLLTRHPLRPGEAEVAENRRARSARLRAAEKVAS